MLAPPLQAGDASPHWQPVEEIAAAAEAFLVSSAGGDDLVVTAGYLDPRLRLPRCTLPLEPFSRHGAKLSGRTVVGIRCRGERAWKVYLPVHVGVMREVAVTSKALPRGHRVGPGDIERAERDVSGMTGAYLTQADDIIGQRLTRSVAGGVVLTPPLLQRRTLIRRGQAVTLNVSGESIDITMAGVAVSDGARDQLIKVKNTGSGKIVEGRVRSASLVEVALR